MRIRLTARQLLAGYAVWMALLLGVHYAVGGGARTALLVLIDVSSAVGILIGVARNSPAQRAPWLLLAAANLTGTLGELAAAVQRSVSHAPLPFPSAADAVYLVEYPLYVAALALFARARSAARSRRSVIDAAVLASGFALLCLLFFVMPTAMNPGFSWLQRVVSAAYPIGDLLILVTLTRLLTPGAWRGAALGLLTIGTVAGIASDVAYDLVQNSADQKAPPLLSLGWMICYIACGAAALHPSMVALTRPAKRVSDTAAGGLILLVLASLTPPVFLIVHGALRRDAVEAAVAVGCGVLYLLMLSRLWDIASSHRRGLLRERTLRMASAALASANSVEEIALAVREAAAGLLPGIPSERTAILAVREGDFLRRVTPADKPPVARPLEPLDLWLRLTAGGTPKFVPLPEIRTARAAVVPGARPPDEPVPAGYEGGLLIRLTLSGRPVGDPFIGLLGAFGDRRTMADLSDTLEILAGQAALAVDRVGLTQEVIRQRGEALFRTLVQDTSDVILIVGDNRRVRYATPSAVDIFGAITIEGALLTDLVAPATRDDVDRVLDLMLTLSGDGASPGYLLQIERLDGRTAVIEVRWSDLRDDASVGGLVLTLRDVTEQHELEEELKYRAFHDSLTGLPNRSLFARETGSALDAARSAGRTVGVLFVDLDDFKMVNDTMGHSVGDELLVAVAARLGSAIRASDTAARLGGDEFAVLIDDAADADAVDSFAQRVVAAFTEPFTLTEARVLASATVGVATSQDSGDTGELLRHADLALYAAKTAGKRRWRHYQPVLTSGMLRRRAIQAALEEAVRSSAFTLAYQPIVALASGEIAGFESLLRWPHPEWGMMLPGQFISLAEETGLIVPVGSWVLNQALQDMARWRRALPPRPPGDPDAASEPHVSVNVSARQFRDPGFADSVRQALDSAGLPASALLLELTESLLLGGNDGVRSDLAELKEIGVRLAIDDFGTGYSSLSYLLELPIDVLKIDKTFVTGIASSWRRHALVEGIIRLARTLEVEVIAEGIESETERELLAGMGCQFGQGYLLSVPVDGDTAAAMLVPGRGPVSGLPRPIRRTPDGRYVSDL
jgi:diguanylate cyclase (GGDEF)-like protein/PAS domain S-box-containing protein